MSEPQTPEVGAPLTDTQLQSLIDYLHQFTAPSALEAISGLLELQERRRDDRRAVERVPKDGGDRPGCAERNRTDA